MFVQVIRGKVSDPSDVRSRDLGPSARPDGHRLVGTTTGVTDDGTVVAVARFDTEESARRNADRPEHERWWTETTLTFDGE